MLTKLKMMLMLVLGVAPAVVSDLEGAIAKIEQDTNLSARVHDWLDLGGKLLQDIAKIL